jgi:ubiquinone/menaquinone biosynthesis C-methylase UbiE
MHEKRFQREIERLRDPERVARLEVSRAVDAVLEGMDGARTLLDVGTGSGVFAEQFAARGSEVTGVDANPAMIPVSQKFVPAGKFREAIAEALPFPDKTFDLVFMGLVLHETDDPQAALNEAWRVAIRRVAVLEWPCEEQPFGPPLSERFSIEQVKAMAHVAGFMQVEPVRLTHVVLYRMGK